MTLVRLLLLSLSFLFYWSPLQAQRDGKAIKAVINRFFEGLETGDTVLLRSTCTEAPLLQTYRSDRQGQMMVVTEDFDAFVGFVGSPRTDHYKEVIKFGAVHFEAALASVWAPYTFYVNGKVSHCGTNTFQLVRTQQGWKIQYILDTRRKDGCAAKRP